MVKQSNIELKQFIFFMFQALYTIFANIVDDGFANRMGLDEVVAYGSYIVVLWTCQCFYNIGKYAYTNLKKNPKTCLLLSIVTSCIISAITFCLSNYIPLFWSLSDTQRLIMSNLIRAHSVCMPVIAIGNFLELFVMYEAENKKLFIADVTYWIIAIFLDTFVYLKGISVHWLCYTTGIAYFVYDVILFSTSGLKKDKLEISYIKTAYLKGKDIVIDRLLGKVATIIYGVYASKLPEYLYAIHCVCYGIITNTEFFTNNFNVFVIQRLFNVEKDKLKFCKKLMTKYFWLIIIIEYASSILLLMIYHGKVSIISCFGWLFLYLTDCISLVFYESFKGVLSSYSKTEYLKYGGLMGIISRVPFILIAYYLGFGLIGFGLASTIDFGIRALYFYFSIKKVENNLKYVE